MSGLKAQLYKAFVKTSLILVTCKYGLYIFWVKVITAGSSRPTGSTTEHLCITQWGSFKLVLANIRFQAKPSNLSNFCQRPLLLLLRAVVQPHFKRL
jgi:hypothetical protein